MIRPSSLPAIAVSPLFEGGVESAAANAGTFRHKIFRRLLEGDANAINEISDPEERDGIKWAADYVQLNAPTATAALEYEREVSFTGPNFERIAGTADVVCGCTVFDLKWRYDNYEEQLAAYCLARMEELGANEADYHILFAECQRVKIGKLTLDEARAIVFGVIEKANSATVCTASQYCGRCVKLPTCEVHTEVAAKICNGYSEVESIKNWHPSKMETGKEIGAALKAARTAQKWIDSVEFNALESAVKRGISIDGFEISTRRGREYVSDVVAAFQAAGISQAEFLKCCSLRLNSSKTFADQVGVRDLFAEMNGLKKAVAKRQMDERLSQVLKRGADSKCLREKNSTKEESNNE